MGKATGFFLLDRNFLEKRIEDLDLKLWWIAENIRVDRKTISRWLSGKVRMIREDNLRALAACLECATSDLMLEDEAEIISTPEEQATAARLILDERLIETLTPLGQWPLLESLVKATMQPNLPSPVLGRLYNHLSICAWRQSEITKSRAYAEKALALGEKSAQPNVVFGAKLNLGTLASYEGRLDEAVELYGECVENSDHLDDARTQAAATSNLAAVYHQLGDFEKSLEVHREAIRLYEGLALPTNISIAYCGLALAQTESGDYEAAVVSLENSTRWATEGKYVRGLAANQVYLADALAGLNRLDEARQSLDSGLRGFGDLRLDEALNHEIAGRIYRRLKLYSEARQALDKGLVAAEGYPTERAAVLVELMRLSRTTGRSHERTRFRDEAIGIYEACGAPLRIEWVKKVDSEPPAGLGSKT